MQQEINNAYIVRTKAVSGCFSMFMLMFGITFTPLFFTGSAQLMESELLLPLMFVLEFLILVPLYYLFLEKETVWKRHIERKVVCYFVWRHSDYPVSFTCYVGDETEAWVMTQVSLHNYAFWLTNLLILFSSSRSTRKSSSEGVCSTPFSTGSMIRCGRRRLSFQRCLR